MAWEPCTQATTCHSFYGRVVCDGNHTAQLPLTSVPSSQFFAQLGDLFGRPLAASIIRPHLASIGREGRREVSFSRNWVVCSVAHWPPSSGLISPLPVRREDDKVNGQQNTGPFRDRPEKNDQLIMIPLEIRTLKPRRAYPEIGGEWSTEHEPFQRFVPKRLPLPLQSQRQRGTSPRQT